VPADEATGIDHALVCGARQAASKREVARGGQPPRAWGGGFEVREQDRRGPARRFRDLLHALEMAQISPRGDRGEHGHAGRRLVDHGGSREPPRLIADVHGYHGDVDDLPPEVRPMPDET
jgi:hypothetical protein